MKLRPRQLSLHAALAVGELFATDLIATIFVIGKVDYRDVMTDPAARHFDESAGIYYIVRDLGVRCWQEEVIFDISFSRYRTRAEAPEGRDPRRYAWEDGEICEYQLDAGEVIRRTALLIHLQKRTIGLRSEPS